MPPMSCLSYLGYYYPGPEAPTSPAPTRSHEPSPQHDNVAAVTAPTLIPVFFWFTNAFGALLCIHVVQHLVAPYLREHCKRALSRKLRPLDNPLPRITLIATHSLFILGFYFVSFAAPWLHLSWTDVHTPHAFPGLFAVLASCTSVVVCGAVYDTLLSACVALGCLLLIPLLDDLQGRTTSALLVLAAFSAHTFPPSSLPVLVKKVALAFDVASYLSVDLTRFAQGASNMGISTTQTQTRRMQRPEQLYMHHTLNSSSASRLLASIRATAAVRGAAKRMADDLERLGVDHVGLLILEGATLGELRSQVARDQRLRGSCTCGHWRRTRHGCTCARGRTAFDGRLGFGDLGALRFVSPLTPEENQVMQMLGSIRRDACWDGCARTPAGALPGAPHCECAFDAWWMADLQLDVYLQAANWRVVPGVPDLPLEVILDCIMSWQRCEHLAVFMERVHFLAGFGSSRGEPTEVMKLHNFPPLRGMAGKWTDDGLASWITTGFKSGLLEPCRTSGGSTTRALFPWPWQCEPENAVDGVQAGAVAAVGPADDHPEDGVRGGRGPDARRRSRGSARAMAAFDPPMFASPAARPGASKDNFNAMVARALSNGRRAITMRSELLKAILQRRHSVAGAAWDVFGGHAGAFGPEHDQCDETQEVQAWLRTVTGASSVPTVQRRSPLVVHYCPVPEGVCKLTMWKGSRPKHQGGYVQAHTEPEVLGRVDWQHSLLSLFSGRSALPPWGPDTGNWYGVGADHWFQTLALDAAVFMQDSSVLSGSGSEDWRFWVLKIFSLGDLLLGQLRSSISSDCSEVCLEFPFLYQGDFLGGELNAIMFLGALMQEQQAEWWTRPEVRAWYKQLQPWTSMSCL